MMSPKIALLLALLLPLGSYATPHSGTSSSFKSGFSSQKSSTAKSTSKFGAFSSRPAATPTPAPAPAATPGTPAANDSSAAPRSGFGSFGNAPAAAQGKSSSALSKDLDQSSANANALKTLDGRQAAAAGAAGGGLPPVNNPVPGQQSGQQPGYGPQPGYAYPQPVIVQQQSSGFGNMFMGFMLGRALSGGHHDTVVYQNGQTAQDGTSNLSPAQVAANDEAMQPKPSFGMKVLRTFLWLLILGCLIWIVVFVLKMMRGGGKPAGRDGSNYSFKRD
jgi:hypothetical protein